MPNKRRRCRRCRNRIDPDHRTCPFCGAEDPLRHHRTRRNVAMAGVLAAVFVLSAWLVLL